MRKRINLKMVLLAWLIGFAANVVVLPLVVMFDSGLQSVISMIVKERKYDNLEELMIYGLICGTSGAILAGLFAWKSSPANKMRALIYVNLLAALFFGAVVYRIRSLVSSV